MYESCINLLVFNLLLLVLVNIAAYGYFRGNDLPLKPEIAIIYYGMSSVGIWQLLYVIPLCMFLKRRRKAEAIRGVILGAVITFLLNSTCWLYVPILLLR